MTGNSKILSYCFRTRSLLAVSIILCLSAESAHAQLSLQWLKQWGTNESETGQAVALDGAGNPYLAGMLGTPAVTLERQDVYVRRYLADGTFDWFTPVGTGQTVGGGKDSLAGLAVDQAGNAYITGRTLDGLGISGLPQGGREGAYAARINANGGIAWTRQIDNTNNTGAERATGIALDNAGNPRFAGISENGLDGASPGAFVRYLRQYSPAGAVQSTTTFTGISANAIDVDSANNTYLVGDVIGSVFGTSAGSRDAALIRLNPDGSVAWARQLGTSGSDQAYDLAVDHNGNIYITGSVRGNLDGINAGFDDVFVARYSSGGTLDWARQFGTSGIDFGNAIDVDANGFIYLAGYTEGNLTGIAKGGGDFFITQFSSDGTQNWTIQDGTDKSDSISGLVVDDLGNLYVAGTTFGDLGGPNASTALGSDAFIANYNVVPEPSAMLLPAMALSLTLLLRRRRQASNPPSFPEPCSA